MTNKLKTILMMAKRGCAVFPVVKGGKKPAVRNGVHAASKDITRIKKRFKTHPEENWGMATGRVSGIIVTDVDGTEGRANLKTLVKANRPLPKTVTVENPQRTTLLFQSSWLCRAEFGLARRQGHRCESGWRLRGITG